MPDPDLDPSIPTLAARLTAVDKALTLAILASLTTNPGQLPAAVLHFVALVAETQP